MPACSPLIGRLNEIRRAHAAFHRFDNVTWLDTHNEFLVGYLKRWKEDAVAVVVNVDPFAQREGLVIVPQHLGLPEVFPCATSSPAPTTRGARAATTSSSVRGRLT